MNKTRQFLALFKFQVAITQKAFLFIMPPAIAAMYYMPFLFHSSTSAYHPGLDQLLSNQNLFLAGFIGVMLLAPEVTRTATIIALWPTGTEFLLTRAADRHLVLRARTVLFYLALLVIPLCAFPFALGNPVLQITEYNETMHQQILWQVSGSIAAKAERNEKSHEITIPGGNALVGSWRIWEMLNIAIAVQVFVFLIYPLKYRRYLLLGAYFALIGLPIFSIQDRILSPGGIPFRETIFFFFVAHQAVAWLATIAVVFLGELWCEHRFARLEH